MNNILKAAFAQTPLVQNLKNGEYMDIILDGCQNLAERFCQIDAHLIQKEMEKAKSKNERILPSIKQVECAPSSLVDLPEPLGVLAFLSLAFSFPVGMTVSSFANRAEPMSRRRHAHHTATGWMVEVAT